MAPPLRVLVVGASVAGPTAAYWFHRAGASVTVIERFPSLRTSGQGIDIRTAGVTVMRRMPGMEEAVRAANYGIEGISFVKEDGTPWGVIRQTGNAEAQGLVSEYEIFRGELSKVIVDLTKSMEGVKYVFGEQVASITQSGAGADGPVSVEFQNGKLDRQQFDLVVACDGATSRTRAIGFECGVQDHMEPINAWAAYFSIPSDLLNGSKIGQAYSVPNPGRFMAIGPDPAGVTRVNFTAVHPRAEKGATLPFREAQKAGDKELRRFVAKHYTGTGWRSDELVKAMLQTDDFYASEIVQVHPPSLSRGRFVLVGDAGYAPGPTGGGTTLAIAGAYILAGEICKSRGDIVEGLRGYEATMRPIVKELQRIPPGVPGFMAPQTAFWTAVRNYLFAFVSWTGIIDKAQKYLGGAFGDAKEYPLPEYPWVR